MSDRADNVEMKDKAKRERSTAYPACSLKEAVEYSKKLLEAYGKSPMDRESAAKGMGFASLSGASTVKVAALVHYGLLVREGNAYKNSLLSNRITYNTTDEDRVSAVVEAAKKPKLFATLITAYAGQAVPKLLNNILVSTHGINRKVADNVAQTFFDSVEYAGILKNGVITTEGLLETEKPDGGDSPHEEGVTNKQVNRDAHHEKQVNRTIQSVRLPSGVVISYPEGLSYSFAVGKFGPQILALEEAVSKSLATHDSTNEHDTTKQQLEKAPAVN